MGFSKFLPGTRKILNKQLKPISLNYFEFKNKISKAKEQFFKEHERLPSTKELINETGFSEKKILETLNTARKKIQLDKPAWENSEEKISDTFVSENTNPLETLDFLELKTHLSSALNVLDEKKKDIVKMWYGLDPYNRTYNYKEIGEKHGLTRDMIRKIKVNSLDRIKNSSHAKTLKEHLN